ncbi:MAG: GWxTD domain-containing protein, partial [bacterium]
ICYEFDRTKFVYTANDEGTTKFANILIAVRIAKAQKIFVNDAWKMQLSADSTTKTTRVLDMVRYGLDPGRYTLSFYLNDLNTAGKLDSMIVDLEINRYKETELILSEIELATNIKKSSSGAQSNFSKNTLDVIPNPSRLYGEGRPVLFFYLEAYNMLDHIQGEKYQTHSWITTSGGLEVTGSRKITRTKNKIVEAGVEVGTMNISKLQSGEYFFNFMVSDLDSHSLAKRSKKFYIYNLSEILAANKARTDMASGILNSEFAQMSDMQLDYEYDLMQYLLNAEGKRFYESLSNTEAKRNFIHTFWKSRDPSPGTVLNEDRQDYQERMRYANEKFRRMGKEGWKTDRGRVYMIYGQPDDVDIFPSTSQTYPHEIWYYNGLEGGVEFVFIDSSGFNEYVLVHSNATGEVHDFNWRQRRAQILR